MLYVPVTTIGRVLAWCGVAVVIPLLTVAVVLALCLLVIVVACALRYARKYCCCLGAPRVGSYTPSSPLSANQQRRRRRNAGGHGAVGDVPRVTATRARTELAYRSHSALMPLHRRYIDPIIIIYFASAAVAVDSSHTTASSSASWSRFSPSNFVSGHVSTMWFMVCR